MSPWTIGLIALVAVLWPASLLVAFYLAGIVSRGEPVPIISRTPRLPKPILDSPKVRRQKLKKMREDSDAKMAESIKDAEHEIRR